MGFSGEAYGISASARQLIGTLGAAVWFVYKPVSIGMLVSCIRAAALGIVYNAAVVKTKNSKNRENIFFIRCTSIGMGWDIGFVHCEYTSPKTWKLPAL